MSPSKVWRTDISEISLRLLVKHRPDAGEFCDRDDAQIGAEVSVSTAVFMC